MGYQLVVEKLDGLKDMFKQTEDGKFVYEVPDAMPETEFKTKLSEFDSEKKAWQLEKDAFIKSVNNLENTAKARKAEREEVENKMKEWIQFENPQKVKDAMARLASLEKSGNESAELSKQLSEIQEKYRNYENELNTIKPQFEELKAYKEKTVKELDSANMQKEVFDIVEKMDGVNKKGLYRSLCKEYGSDLIRNEAGNIVSKAGESLVDYAKKYAEDFNYFLPNTAGISNPGNSNMKPKETGNFFADLAAGAK